MCCRAARPLNALARISEHRDSKPKHIIYNSFVASNFDYGPLVWHFCGQVDNNKLVKLQERSLRIIHNDYESSFETLQKCSKQESLLTKKLTRQIWGIWKLRPAYSPETPNLGQNRWCFVPCDLEIWWMTLENNRASLLCCFKLCATFHSHWWIQTGVTVRKRPNLGQIRRFLEPCDLAIWCMTLKNNRAPLLCYFKIYASFRSHRWTQAGVTVRKRPIWVKIDDFF